MSDAPQADPPSPCIDVCTLGPGNQCLGCFRSLDEIGAWAAMSAEERWAVLRACERRRASFRGVGSR